jgi:ATP-dependent DNA helicase RecG
MSDFLQMPIEFIKGVGPQRADLLKKELGIFTPADMLSYYPFRYVDRSKFYKIAELQEEFPYVQIKGKISRFELLGDGRTQRLSANFYDESGHIELVWFKGVKWIRQSLKTGVEYIVFGKASSFKKKLNIVHPDIDESSSILQAIEMRLQPMYPSSEKLNARNLNSRGIEKIMRQIIAELKGELRETLPEYLLRELALMPYEQAVRQVHYPSDAESLKKAQFRLKFEELLMIQLQLLRLKLINQQSVKGFMFSKVGEHFLHFYEKELPFELTNAQKKVIKEIRADVGSGKQMNRLLQGDVGSGKTIVSLLVMLIALDNNFQCALMAPTEILANQHFKTISDQLSNTNISVALLTGSTKAAERKKLHKSLENGETQILIGTHALIEDKVQFKNLGLVVIDEQHRFGVAQRAKLWKKNTNPPHILVMTATPIPRTLAMTLYGDLEISSIDELPPGRKTIKTVHYFENARLKLNHFLKVEIKKGRQVYIVYPLIKESEALDYKHLEEGYESVKSFFPEPEFLIGIVNGQMKAEDKDYEMKLFAEGKTHILMATTVIEVGVNVPNASVMVVESAERFGLSQLHQLRGRVGRGAEQSYCILMSGYKLSSDARLRMETMCRTNNGFEIAEVDLKIRGPGDMLGTKQSGVLDLAIANLATDGEILGKAREIAINILNRDSNLSLPENARLKNSFTAYFKKNTNWGRIS